MPIKPAIFCRVALRVLLWLIALAVGASQPSANADVFWVNFDQPSFSISDGTAGSVFGYFNDTASVVQFDTVSNFGLNGMSGGDRTVMRFPAFGPTEGLQFNPNVAANGGGTFLNQYTMMWDVYIDKWEWMSLYQTNATNVNDGELFIRPSDGAIGISGVYDGVVERDRWNRIGVTVDLSLGNARMRKFINGTLVGTNDLSGVDGRWSMYHTGVGGMNYLLTDDNGDTNDGWISAFYFSDQVLSDSVMAAWGGVHANGFAAIPEPGSVGLLAVIATIAIGASRRRSVA